MEKKTEAQGKKKCIHEGHRARLSALAKNAGLDSMSEVQVMEFFLTYIFPRGDVNPLAHRLLDEYETFTNVIDAEAEDLMRIHGINERSARMINMFGELFYYYATARMGKKFIVRTMADLIDVAEDYLRFRTTENMLIMALSPANILTHKRRIDMNKNDEVGVSFLEFTNFIANAKPASMVIAHCHPYGSAKPSEKDVESYKKIGELCTSCGVRLIDSMIVGEDGVYSQLEEKFYRTYRSLDVVKESFQKLISGQ
ncbi:MAG: hypothetical protein J6K39_01445 [Clostridia bacterium]|nr:hypothetical protein [Clostridia bacterium]